MNAVSPSTASALSASTPTTYFTYGYSVNDARRPFPVAPPGEADRSEPLLRGRFEGGALQRDCGAGQWSGLPPRPAAVRPPMPCGVLWFTHISKTGGETVRQYLKGRGRKFGWPFLDLYTRSSPMSLRRAGRWEIERHVHSLARHLNRTRPRLVVHQHDGVGGLGDYFLDRVLRPLSCRLQAETDGECKVVIATVLREPVSRLLSQARSDNLRLSEFPAFARAQANFQTKYLLFATDWRVGSLFLANATVEESLLAPARSLLAHTNLIGRTEELGNFLAALDATMGWMEQGALGVLAPVHSGHRSVMQWNLSQADADLAHRYNTIDARLYRSFCGSPRAGMEHERGKRRGQQQNQQQQQQQQQQSQEAEQLCHSNPVTRGLPHYYASSIDPASISSRTPAPSEWQMVFDGRACHGFDLGSAYRMRCDSAMSSTLGSSLGSVSGYRRERSGKLVAEAA